MKNILITISTLIFLIGCASNHTSATDESFEISQEEYNSFSDEIRNYYDQLTPNEKKQLEIQRRIAGCENRIKEIKIELTALSVKLRTLEKNEMMPYIVDQNILEKELTTAKQKLNHYKKLADQK